MTFTQYQQIISAGDPVRHQWIVFIGSLLGLLLIVWDARAWSMPLTHRMGLLAAVLFSGVFGSGWPELFAKGLIQVRAAQCTVNPKTIIGGLFFGFMGAAVYKKIFRLNVETSDAFARGTCLMVAIGKLGCYAAHCCFGIATTSRLGQDFGDGAMRLPVQLMESAAFFVLFGVLSLLQRKKWFQDRRVFVFMTCYGVLRFGFEFLREPIADSFWGLGFYQWLALVLTGTGIFQIIRRTLAPQEIHLMAPTGEIS